MLADTLRTPSSGRRSRSASPARRRSPSPSTRTLEAPRLHPKIDLSGVQEDDDEDKEDEEEDEEEATFVGVFTKFPDFRLCLISYIVALLGEWLTYVASITLIEDILAQHGEKSRTAISSLVVIRLIPHIAFSPFGGVLADSMDRRQCMIILNLVGAAVPLLFLVAMELKSIQLIYWVMFLKECVASFYEPSRSAIIPLLVPEEKYLEKGTTLSEGMWSVVAAGGSAFGGVVLGYFGFKTCFYLDSVTYLISAYVMWLVNGTYNVAPDETPYETPWEQIRGMMKEGTLYLRSSICGSFVLIKATGALIYGASDVLNVSFSEAPYFMADDDDNIFSDSNNVVAVRLGTLFAMVGIGCLAGPLVADYFTSMEDPVTLQRACIAAMGLAAFGCLGMGLSPTFWSVCVFTFIRSAGDSLSWIDSTLLLQVYAEPEMLGRVTSVEYALACVMEAFGAYLCGALEDQGHLTGQNVSLVLAVLGFIVSTIWLLWHLAGGGAANPKLVIPSRDDDEEVATEKTALMPVGNGTLTMSRPME